MKDENAIQTAAATNGYTKDQFALREGALFALDTSGPSPITVFPDGRVTITYILKQSSDLRMGPQSSSPFPPGNAYGVFNVNTKNNYIKGAASELVIYTTSTEVGIESDTDSKEINIITDGGKRESGQGFVQTLASERKDQ